MEQPAAIADRSTVLTALFRSTDDADRAYRATTNLGYRAEDINVLMSDATRQRYLSNTRSGSALSEKAAEPVPEASTRAGVLGGPVGGTMGTVAPAMAAIGAALLLPGLGMAVAGPIAIALTAAGTAGVATGLIGAFTNWGIPSSQAERYERALRNGGIVLGVETKSPTDHANLARVWKENGGESMG